MTLEEAKTLADQGNINAMVALGDYYSSRTMRMPWIYLSVL